MIDSSYQTCCFNGVEYAPRVGLGSCCGADKLFNPETDMCCERHQPNPASEVHVIGQDAVIDGDFECCGLTAINTTKTRCCNQVRCCWSIQSALYHVSFWIIHFLIAIRRNQEVINRWRNTTKCRLWFVCFLEASNKSDVEDVSCSLLFVQFYVSQNCTKLWFRW